MLKVVAPFILGVVVGISIFNFGIKTKLEPQVLAEKVEAQEPTPTATDTNTPSPEPTETATPQAEPDPALQEKPTPTPKQTPTSKPTPTPTPQPTFTSEQIYGFTERFGAQYAVSPDVLRHIALCESGFNQFAKNGAYWGLYQFGPITWGNYRRLLGEDPDPNLRLNAEEAVQTAAYALSLGKSRIWPNCAP